jgi:ribosomal protein S18 acetylase RimI-like enzyme
VNAVNEFTILWHQQSEQNEHATVCDKKGLHERVSSCSWESVHTEFRRAIVPRETRSLAIFDHKAFSEHPGDWFESADWAAYESWWMIVNNRKVGCCAFELHVDFKDDIRGDGNNPHTPASLYIATTGILPSFRGLGFGNLMKHWQVSYARYHRFTRIVTNTRKSNKRMINLNNKFGFRILRTTSNYYENPPEPTVVMELSL